MTNDVNYNQLGQRIKHYRQKVHKTQEQLAAQMDVATSTVAHAENGTSKPSLPLLIKTANALGVTLDQLVCDSLPVAESYLEKDIADLLADCTMKEKKIIKDIIVTTKKTLREHK